MFLFVFFFSSRLFQLKRVLSPSFLFIFSPLLQQNFEDLMYKQIVLEIWKLQRSTFYSVSNGSFRLITVNVFFFLFISFLFFPGWHFTDWSLWQELIEKFSRKSFNTSFPVWTFFFSLNNIFPHLMKNLLDF